MQKWKKVLGGVTLAAMSGLAMAGPPDSDKACCSDAQDEKETQVSFELLSDTASGDEEAGATGFKWIGNLGEESQLGSRDLDGESIEVKIENGEVTVIHNGKKLPTSAYRQVGNIIVLRAEGVDDKGQYFSQLITASDDPFLHMDDAQITVTPSADRPPVMMGVMMGEPDEALRVQLGLGDRPAIMIDDVLEGLPADEAGLRKYDIVVAIDGDDDNVSVPHLTEILRNKKPGDELKFRVIRGGEKETVRIKLRAYSAERLGVDSDDIEEVVISQSWGNIENGPAGNIEKLVGQLRGAGLDEDRVEQIQRRIELAIKEAMQSSMSMRGPQARLVHPEGTVVVPGPQGRNMFEFQVPGGQNLQVPESMRQRFEVQRRSSGDMERRLEALERRMDEVSDRIESRMDRMMDRFEKLVDRIENSLDDR